jgi:ATP-binding cassette subfamily C protein LapB
VTDDEFALVEKEVSDVSTRERPPADDLLGCLLILARIHDRAITPEAALAGLPLDAGSGLTPSLFGRAARRAGLSSRLVTCELDDINAALLPAVLMLEGDRACVLVAPGRGETAAQVIFPELGHAVVELPAAELDARYLGRAIYARPQVEFDARSPELGRKRGGHWFWSVIKENRALYRDVLVAAALINVFAVAMPLYVMNVYDRVVPNHAIETLWVLTLGLVLVLVGEFALRVMRGHFVDLAGSRADMRISADIMARVLDLRMEARPASAGSFAANLRAFETVRDFISSATVVTLVDLPFALLFMAVIGWIALPMVLPFLVAVPLLLAYAWYVQGTMRALAETSHRASAQRNAALVEGLVGLETLKAHVAEARFQRRWEQSAAQLSRVGSQLRLLSATVTNGTTLAQHLVSMSMIVVGVYLISDGQLSMGGLIACYILSSRAMGPLGQAAGLLMRYHRASTALEVIDKVMHTEVERPDDKRFISRGRLQGDIEFRDVSFAYPGLQGPVLRNVSLHIRSGERVGILGRIGSGKSTLEKLILGLYRPSSGAVLVDGIDVRQLDPAELRRNIGYVQQDVTLFYGSLRDNIVLGAPLADDADVVNAARIGGVLEFANAHPAGFDMVVGERGESLSGGQRQGVAIARAVIGSPPILLLDEPTASMDHSSEDAAKRSLGEFCAGRTVLIVTHRTSLLDLVDRIIVVDGGKVVADGPKAQVIEALRQGRIGRAA